MTMRVGVLGTGPVGLATAERAQSKGYHVTLFGSLLEKEYSTRTYGFKATYPAAAAFWTPFCSGMNPQDERSSSILSLEFYQHLLSLDQPHGVVLRTIQQHFLKGTSILPAWRDLPGLSFRKSKSDLPYFQHSATSPGLRELAQKDIVETRVEFQYRAPAIQVELFIPWYRNRVCSLRDVKFVEVTTPFVGRGSDDPGEHALNYWKSKLSEEKIEHLVVCTGAGTFYGGVIDTFNDSFQPRKGVVAHLPIRPKKRDPVILFEGGFFESETLYLVPLFDRFLLGGTIHPISPRYEASMWEVSHEEQQGILERALTFLPTKYREIVSHTPREKFKWLAGVRPVVSPNGPIVGLSDELTDLLGGMMKVYLNCGHGGSGFTFCQDTAEKVVNEISLQ